MHASISANCERHCKTIEEEDHGCHLGHLITLAAGHKGSHFFLLAADTAIQKAKRNLQRSAEMIFFQPVSIYIKSAR